MAHGSTGGPVQPIDYDMVRRIFGDHVAVVPYERGDTPDTVRICLECATLGHICRRHRAERYHARQAAKRPTLWRRLRAWWQGTTLYAMNRDYPVALPLTVGAGVAWGAYATLGLAYLVNHL